MLTCHASCSAVLTSVSSVFDVRSLEKGRCDWLHPVIDEPISGLSDPADWFIIDAVVLYIGAGSPLVRRSPSLF